MNLKKILIPLFLGLGVTSFSAKAVLNNKSEVKPKEWMGIPYPMNRWGVSILGVNQVEKGSISNVDISLKEISMGNSIVGLQVVNPDSIKVEADVKLVKLDYFLLPFLSIYGIYGQVEAQIDMKAGHPEISIPTTGNSFNDLIISGVQNGVNQNLEKLKLNGNFKTEGEIFGAGALLAGEYKNIFAMMQYTYSEIHMKNGLAKKKAEMANARLGYSFKPQNRFIKTFTPYLGVAYQLMDTQVKAGIDDFTAIIDLELDDITPAAGFFMNLPHNLTLLVEVTWGTRDSVAIDLGYRF